MVLTLGAPLFSIDSLKLLALSLEACKLSLANLMDSLRSDDAPDCAGGLMAADGS